MTLGAIMGDSRDVGFHINTVRDPQNPVGTYSGNDRQNEGPALTFPRRFVPPSGAVEFLLQDERDSIINDDRSFDGTRATQLVPEGYLGVVRAVQFITSVADATIATLRFRVEVNAQGVPGYSSISVFQAGGVQSTALDTWIPVPGGSTVGAGYLIAVAGHHVGFLMQGWFWPSGEGRS